MNSPVRTGHRPLQFVLRLALVLALVAGGIEWVRITVGDGSQQRRTPIADLDAAQVAAARQMPVIAEGIPVLTYHGVSDEADDDFTVTPTQLSAHLAALKAAGFSTVRLSTVQAYLRGEHPSLPPRPVLLTFDDGTASTWTVVDSLLRDYGFNAAGFLITGSLAPEGVRSYYLSKGQAASLARNGRWEFGGHTDALHRAQPAGEAEPQPALDHRILGATGGLESLDDWRRRVAADLARSQATFVDLLGHPATAFAYPFSADGSQSNDAAIAGELPDLLAAAGYTTAFVGEQADLGAAVFPDSDPFHLHRLGVRSSTTVEDLLQRIARLNPAPLPGDLTALSWDGTGATCSVEPGATLVVRVDSVSGRCSTSANTARWRDYHFSADIEGADRSTTVIVALRELHNIHGTITGGRLEVSIGESAAEIREVVEGSTRVLAQLALPALNRPAVRHLDVTLRGSEAVVLLDAGSPTRVHLSPGTSAGGVGFRVSSPAGHPVVIREPRVVATTDEPPGLTARWWSTGVRPR